MKGYILIANALASLRRRPATTKQLAKRLETGYIPVVALVSQLKATGLIRQVDSVRSGKGPRSAVYGFAGGEVAETGRPQMRKFTIVWNAMLEPESVEGIGEQADLRYNSVSSLVNLLRSLKLVHVADWHKGVGAPAALYGHGAFTDAPRPPPNTDAENDRRADEARRRKRLRARLTFSPARAFAEAA